MNEWLEEFEELLDRVITDGTGKDFDEFKERIIERMEEIE